MRRWTYGNAPGRAGRQAKILSSLNWGDPSRISYLINQNTTTQDTRGKYTQVQIAATNKLNQTAAGSPT